MALKFSKKAPAPAPTATVSKELKEKSQTISETQEQETPKLPVEPIKETSGKPWCEVGFEASYTHNLGNYQSAKVTVMLKIPCTHPEIDHVYEVAKTWVNTRMEAVIGELEG
jgi:hypothetical protein